MSSVTGTCLLVGFCKVSDTKLYCRVTQAFIFLPNKEFKIDVSL